MRARTPVEQDGREAAPARSPGAARLISADGTTALIAIGRAAMSGCGYGALLVPFGPLYLAK